MHPALPYGHSTNLVGVPSGLISSVAFNDYPMPLSIRSARATNPVLFDMLTALIAAQGRDAYAIAESFAAWMKSGPRDIGNTCRRYLSLPH